MFLLDDDDFTSVWLRLKPCDSQQADYISMKLSMQKKKCIKCERCIGEECDIYTSCEEKAMFGKYLIECNLNGK